MTDHLPECPVPGMDAAHGPLHPEDAEANCICIELRACEQRALDAAREAVEREWTEDPSWDGTNWNNALTVAMDAIDALREEKK